MLPATALALFLGCWASIYLIDAFIKSHKVLSRPYVEFLASTGISVSMCQVRWFSTCLNRFFIRLGQMKPNFLRIWFTCGVCFGLIAMVMSVFLLSLLVFNTLRRAPVQEQVLTPVMPGVNLPMSQIYYYLLTLLVCGVLHEMGHAIAAVREQVRVNGFGLFIFGIYPGAFVDLYTDHLQVISPLRQLRIFCAGVWHNFIIVILALAVLFTLPYALMPFYTTGNSVLITSVKENSAISGPKGLAPGDHVTNIGGCRVTSVADWVTCIRVAMEEKNIGYCMPLNLLQQQDIATSSYVTIMGNVECCANTSNTHLCFMYYTKSESEQKYACLPARSTTDRQTCHLQSDCYNPTVTNVCAIPSLDNSTKLLRVMHLGKPPLLFLGHPLDLHYSATLSDYVPNNLLVPINLPYCISTFCKYLISLSGALALLNVVPCYALDGQFILRAFVELGLRSTIPDKETRTGIFRIVLLFGTLLLGLNIILAMWMLFIT